MRQNHSHHQEDGGELHSECTAFAARIFTTYGEALARLAGAGPESQKAWNRFVHELLLPSHDVQQRIIDEIKQKCSMTGVERDYDVHRRLKEVLIIGKAIKSGQKFTTRSKQYHDRSFRHYWSDSDIMSYQAWRKTYLPYYTVQEEKPVIGVKRGPTDTLTEPTRTDIRSQRRRT
jgi:hypothetical protein